LKDISDQKIGICPQFILFCLKMNFAINLLVPASLVWVIVNRKQETGKLRVLGRQA